MKKATLLLLLAVLVILSLSAQGWSGIKRRPIEREVDEQPIYWYEREVKKQAWMALDEMAVFASNEKMTRAARDLVVQQLPEGTAITESSDFIMYLKLPAPLKRARITERLSSVRTLESVRQTSPVFYTSKDRASGTRLVLTGEIIVQFPQEYTEGEIVGIEEEYGINRLKAFSFAPNTFLYQAGDPLHSLEVANDLYESGRANYAYPNWIRKRAKRAAPNDSLYPDQWHLNNTGQFGGTAGEDVNVASVWDTYRGSASEVIAVVDDGLEIGHEDLSDNIVAGISWDFVGSDNDPSPVLDIDDHGTAVAGVAAGVGFNAKGITGAAPGAGLVGLRLLGPNQTDAKEATALSWEP
ncbi:MAG: S8 family serine peptidase, partial [Deltaproteobacteria bacterium]|nr:S8 family serine peptidase [Deltaproteobacteria bacterium]